jgi:hypothetical protein
MQTQFINSLELSQGFAKFQGDTLIRFINSRNDRLSLQPYGLVLSRKPGRQKDCNCYPRSSPNWKGGLYPNKGTMLAQIDCLTVDKKVQLFIEERYHEVTPDPFELSLFTNFHPR